MENERVWEKVSNMDEKDSNNLNHNIKMAAKSFCRECENNNIPVFVAYYLPEKGYQYRATFPEEIGTPEVESEYGKFKEFLKVCIGFNKEDYFPHIH